MYKYSTIPVHNIAFCLLCTLLPKKISNIMIGASAVSPYLVISTSTLSVYTYVYHGPAFSVTPIKSIYTCEDGVEFKKHKLLLLFIFMHLLINCYNLWLRATWKHLHLAALAPNMLCMLLVNCDVILILEISPSPNVNEFSKWAMECGIEKDIEKINKNKLDSVPKI